MPLQKSKNPEDPIQYLWELSMEPSGLIIKVILDYLQESECPMEHFASHSNESWGMLEEATRYP